jgi:hypothetical protein
MTKLILPRRRFLFLAPAIVAASNLMPGHSIAHLLTPSKVDFWAMNTAQFMDWLLAQSGRIGLREVMALLEPEKMRRGVIAAAQSVCDGLHHDSVDVELLQEKSGYRYNDYIPRLTFRQFWQEKQALSVEARWELWTKLHPDRETNQ